MYLFEQTEQYVKNREAWWGPGVRAAMLLEVGDRAVRWFEMDQSFTKRPSAARPKAVLPKNDISTDFSVEKDALAMDDEDHLTEQLEKLEHLRRAFEQTGQ
jgi:hypothetical protein